MAISSFIQDKMQLVQHMQIISSLWDNTAGKEMTNQFPRNNVQINTFDPAGFKFSWIVLC